MPKQPYFLRSDFLKRIKKFFLKLIITAIVLCVIFSGLYFLSSKNIIDVPFFGFVKSGKFETALNEYNYQAAATVFLSTKDTSEELEVLRAHLNTYFDLCFTEQYDDTVWQKYRGLEIFAEHIKSDVFTQAESTVKRFYSGEFTETQAKTYLSRICKFGFAKNKLSDCRDGISYKKTSDEAFSSAAEMIINGDYPSAVKELRKVSEFDEAKYSAAIEGIESCKNVILSQKIGEAEAFLADGNKQRASETAYELYELFPDDESVKNLKAKTEN